jgi:hypothetical protein
MPRRIPDYPDVFAFGMRYRQWVLHITRWSAIFFALLLKAFSTKPCLKIPLRKN